MSGASPSLNASKDPAAPEPVSLEPATPSMAQPKLSKKSEPPSIGDHFESSLGFGGNGCEPLAVGLAPKPELSRLMKNLLFAPTHPSYEKMAETRGHPLGAYNGETNGIWYVLPVLCRDATKFARPVIPVVRVNPYANNCRLVYVVYGNSKTEPPVGGGESTIMYNLDKDAGLSLSSHIKYLPPTKTSQFKQSMIDHQHRYILTALCCLKEIGGNMDVCVANHDLAPTILKHILDCMCNGISLLVVDVLTSDMKEKIRHTHGLQDMPELGALSKGASLLAEYNRALNDSFVNSELLKATRALASLNVFKSTSKAPSAPDSEEVAKPAVANKRPIASTLADPKKEDGSVSKKAKKDKKDKKKDLDSEYDSDDDSASDDEEEEEMSGSGSDEGSGDSGEEESEEEESEDSDEEEDSEDDDEPKKKKVTSARTTPTNARTDPALVPTIRQEQAQRKESKEGKESKGDKAEKEKRKPAKFRRQGVATYIRGVLEQGRALDDAVPTSHQDRLAQSLDTVETTLKRFVDEGKVPDVQNLVEASWSLTQELFTLINKMGASNGPRAPDSAASRQLALSMGRLFEQEEPDIQGLSKMLSHWAEKMTDMVCRRAKAVAEGNRAASQLSHHHRPNETGSSS